MFQMSSMACYLRQESGSILSAGDDLSENQIADQGIYWTLWNSRLSDDLNTTSLYLGKHGKGAAQCFNAAEHQRSGQLEKFAVSARSASSDCSTNSEEQSEGPASMELQHTEQTNDIFLSQFSDEEMMMMDAPFQALDMFPDSMHRLLSYENMLSGVLTDFQDQEANLDQNEMDTMDTCGFPLFSHGLQDDLSNADGSLPSCVKLKPNSSEIPLDTSKDKARVSTIERSGSVADTESSPDSEAAVLEELEEVVFQLTKKTRVCLRDAFYRLAESSNAQHTAGLDEQGFQQSEGTECRVSTSGCAERGTNAIDRTVAILTFTG